MKYLLIIVLGLLIRPITAQDIQQKGKPESDSVTLEQALKYLESNSEYKFYYRKSWLQDIAVSKSVKVYKMPEQLEELLSGTLLDFHIIGNQIILLNDARIITDPAINSFFNNKTAYEAIQEEVLFSREVQSDNKNLELVMNNVGSKNKYIKDGKSSIAGYVKERDSGDPVEGAFVYLESPFVGTSTDVEGFYTLSVPNGKRKLIVQSVNMKNTSRKLMVFSSGKFDVEMEVDVIALNAVVVNANREVNVKSPQMGMTKIDPESLKIMPALLGEKDMVKVATTTAGVQYLGEGSAGINIRGGKADQNLFLLDGAPVYNTNHFFGFFSVFNADALSGMNLYKSSIPAEFGGRLSSVFDIGTKTPNKEKFSGSGGIGPVTSRLMLETPIGKKGPSVMLGGRATYSDYVLKKIKNSPLKNNEAYFYDVVGKIDHKINDKNEISLSGYYSKDQFQLASDTLLSYTDFSYSNKVLSLKWKHVFNDKLLGDFQIGTSNYDYNIGYDVLPTQAFTIDFGLKENSLSAKFDKYIDESLNLKFGAQVKYFEVNPGVKAPSGTESLVAPDEIEKEQGLEIAPFISAVYSPSDKVTIDGGLRYSVYNVMGPASVNQYAEGSPKDSNFLTGTTQYESGERIKTYHGPEFRISSRYSLSENSSVKGSYGRTRQNVHLLLNSASISPTDMWRLSSAHIKPQIADQFSLGYYKNFYGKHSFETSVEVYYKRIQNLVDFKVGADLQFNKAIETDILQGPGKAYGVEFSIKKTSGWLTGWLNYTYSRSLIQLNGAHPDEVINGGEFFPTGYDKPHYLNSITNYKFTRRFTMTLNVVYATGVPVTTPLGKWNFKGSENLLYSDRNADRIPDYFRMDLGFNLEGSHKIKKLAHSSWTFSVYNLLGRDNIYSVFFRVEEGQVKGYKMTVFSSPIPTITYNFSF